MLTGRSYTTSLGRPCLRESEASAGEFPLVFDGLGVFRGHFYRVIDFPNPRQNCHRTTVAAIAALLQLQAAAQQQAVQRLDRRVAAAQGGAAATLGERRVERQGYPVVAGEGRQGTAERAGGDVIAARRAGGGRLGGKQGGGRAGEGEGHGGGVDGQGQRTGAKRAYGHVQGSSWSLRTLGRGGFLYLPAEKEKGLRSRRLFFCGARYVDGNACSGATADGLPGWTRGGGCHGDGGRAVMPAPG